MNIATPQPSIKDLIAAAGDRLTATERRIVEAVIEDRTLLAFGTVTDLASRVGTSRASIVRFAKKLGLGGYTDLQDYARAGMAREISRPSERISLITDLRTSASPILTNARFNSSPSRVLINS